MSILHTRALISLIENVYCETLTAFHAQQLVAYAIWQKRQARGIEGDAVGDWIDAGNILNAFARRLGLVQRW